MTRLGHSPRASPLVVLTSYLETRVGPIVRFTFLAIGWLPIRTLTIRVVVLTQVHHSVER